MTPAERNLVDLLDAFAGKPRKPMRRAQDGPTENFALTTDNLISSATGAPIDSDECLFALMDTINRSCTPSTDPSRLAIADAIARHLGIDNPAGNQRSGVGR